MPTFLRVPEPAEPPDGPRFDERKGRAAGSNRGSRFHAWIRQADPEAEVVAAQDDPDFATCAPATEVVMQAARSILSRNQSPDIPFDRSINPYQGCEHACIYCYARPTHAYLGLSPGLDFERRIFAKENAAELLSRELSRPSYQPGWVALGANTDPYQPVERRLGITRSVLEVLARCGHPVGIVTKSALILRDLDLLAPMAQRGLVNVLVSVTTLDRELARTLEPRANTPARRIEAIRALAAAGIPVGVSVAPIIPALNDHEIESILEAARDAGASFASRVLLRLPLEVRDLFVEWLEHHQPGRAAHVMSLVRQMHGGRDHDPRFGARMRGQGVFAGVLDQRFALALRRLGLQGSPPPLEIRHFSRPGLPAACSLPVQSDLFGA